MATAAIQAKRMMITIRNEALPHGKNRKTTKSALAAAEATASGHQLASLRTARAIVNRASTPIAMINRNAIPCTQPCHVSGSPPLSIGTSTRNAANISDAPSSPSSTTAKPLARRRPLQVRAR